MFCDTSNRLAAPHLQLNKEINTKQAQQPFDPEASERQGLPSLSTFSVAYHKTNGCIWAPGFIYDWGMLRNGCLPLHFHKTPPVSCESTEQKSWKGHRSRKTTFDIVVMFYGHWWRERYEGLFPGQPWADRSGGQIQFRSSGKVK